MGSRGRVVATDIDTRFLRALRRPNLEVRCHDIVVDSLEVGAFDLVHARLVLAHLQERDGALISLVDALRPGGWLLVEEMDFRSLAPVMDDRRGALFLKVAHASSAVLRARGFDPQYGGRLAADVQALGLTELGGEGRSSVCSAGSPGAHARRTRSTNSAPRCPRPTR